MHLHRRLLERSEFRAVWNQDADSIQTSVEIDAHAVLIKLPRVDFAPVLVGVRGPDSDRAGRKLGGG
jgi:hypothetical protein